MSKQFRVFTSLAIGLLAVGMLTAGAAGPADALPGDGLPAAVSRPDGLAQAPAASPAAGPTETPSVPAERPATAAEPPRSGGAAVPIPATRPETARPDAARTQATAPHRPVVSTPRRVVRTSPAVHRHRVVRPASPRLVAAPPSDGYRLAARLDRVWLPLFLGIGF
ncbi:hypothetical protein RHODGE_RHODGE_00274 [Rhodoplanes serenus]|uniref:Uncharacterized protein n=1 Tax=Rhodoplanes serenus TaxID=200615 RepID=A0A3S5CY39_9BRAD|nr:hypothetical protein [Rhodoplanes serenus]VCU07169.1 hypothetical protein RHODGE_RHODGE_00274 [Rhodoplanes serenus]